MDPQEEEIQLYISPDYSFFVAVMAFCSILDSGRTEIISSDIILLNGGTGEK